MAQQPPLTRLSRRDFLLAAGAAAALPLLSSSVPFAGRLATGWQARNDPLKVGVMLPHSRLYPAMGQNLLAGMQLLFGEIGKTAGQAAEVIVEDIGLGPVLARQKAQKLVEAHRVDVAVGLLNTEVATQIQHVFEASQIPFIVSNVGANLAHPSSYSPYVFHNSLAYWQANWAMGRWASNEMGRRAFVTASRYESGYDSLYAFSHGFEAAGGQILHTYVSEDTSERDLASLFAKIEESEPDFVYALYSGQEAVDFVQAYAQSPLSRRFPLFTSAFTVDETLLMAQRQAARNIGSCLPWAVTLDTPENRAFMAAYQEAAGQPADVFAVLGYDTARLITEAAGTATGSSGPALAKALQRVSFISPRGPLSVNPDTHTVVTPLYLRRVQLSGNRFQNVVTAQLDSVTVWDAELPDVKTGWLNPYLCA